MCGRFVLAEQPQTIAEVFHVTPSEQDIEPSYNIAPTQQVAAVRWQEGERELVGLRWGLLPSWSKAMPTRTNLINARAETVATKPSFRTAYKRRRCLIPTNGFYEWKTTNGQKQPFFIHLPEQRLFAFAGLWECWHMDDKVIESCAVITTEANADVASIHQRMPVIIDEANYAVWIGEQAGDVEALLQPYPDGSMIHHAVSTYVNASKNNDLNCLKSSH